MLPVKHEYTCTQCTKGFGIDQLSKETKEGFAYCKNCISVDSKPKLPRVADGEDAVPTSASISSRKSVFKQSQGVVNRIGCFQKTLENTVGAVGAFDKYIAGVINKDGQKLVAKATDRATDSITTGLGGIRCKDQEKPSTSGGLKGIRGTAGRIVKRTAEKHLHKCANSLKPIVKMLAPETYTAATNIGSKLRPLKKEALDVIINEVSEGGFNVKAHNKRDKEQPSTSTMDMS